MYKKLQGVGDVMLETERHGYTQVYLDMAERRIFPMADGCEEPMYHAMFCGYATDRMTADEIVAMVMYRYNNFLELRRQNGVSC